MRWRYGLPAALCALAGCSAQPQAEPAIVEVVAAGETAPVGNDQDAADDPAIWRNAENPAASLIVATDKQAGLYVYGLDGKVRSFLDAGRVNNVDLVELDSGEVVVAASDRGDPANAMVDVYLLDTAAGRLEPIGSIPAGNGEAYGFCLWRDGANVHTFSVLKDGRIAEASFGVDGGRLAGIRTDYPARKLATQAEGCVTDPRDGTLYVGEEDVGIWRFARGETEGRLIAKADGHMLVADVEGLALLPQGTDGGLLIGSSQGDNAYAVYRLPDFAPAGRFRIAAGAFGATEETDGIALSAGDFGPLYPSGLFVAQDGANGQAAQNFKLVPWHQIEEALKQWKPPAR